MKWLFDVVNKWIWNPLRRLWQNHLVSGFFSFSWWRLLETWEANQILSNIMMYFAIMAFTLYLLEKLFGITTPLINVGKIFKPIRNSNVLTNPSILENNIELTYRETQKLYNYGGKRMKNFLKLVYANKMSLIGIVASALYVVELVWNVSAKWNLDKEWYYTIAAGMLVFINIAIGGRGLESIEQFFNIKDTENQLKQNKKIQKQIEKARKLKEFMSLAESQPQPQTQETKKETQAEILERIKRQNGNG